ncbi:MAG: radical SAM protein [Deltaproteobacteria bacterium]|nr:radical SAM protein [Deltaproteobacteria bacterium]
MTEALWFQTIRNIWRSRIPGQLIIQMTDACNARCPQCGMRVTEDFKRSRLSLDTIRRSIDAAAEKGFQAISFTGGEPLLFLDDLIEMIRYAGHAGIPYIRTGTNGFVFMGSDKKGFNSRIERIAHALADTPIRNFWISIDSAVPEVHESMRGLPGVIDGIHKALPIFHASGIYPSANLGINRNLAGEVAGNQRTEPDAFHQDYRSGFNRFYRFVCDLGFTMANCCYPMSIPGRGTGSGLSPVYAATATDDIVNFSRIEKTLLYRALLETIPYYRSRIRIFTPRTSLLALTRQLTRQMPESHPCRGGIDFFFIDAKTGHTYPCGYRGHTDLGGFEELNPSQPLKNSRDCRECDWECFRDPSELMGPVLDMRNHPVQAIKRLATDRTYTRLWLEDLRYYQACGVFDGRKAPDQNRLRQYAL